MSANERTYFEATVRITDVWGFKADAEAARRQVIKLLEDRLDVDVLAVDVTLIDRGAWEQATEDSINEEGAYARQGD